MTAALVGLACIALGYIAGRLHGKSKHHAFLADGFRYLDRIASTQLTYTSQGRTVTELDVCRAFGSGGEDRD